MKYLGIDYGKRKVGLAYSEGETASAGEVLRVRSLGDAACRVRKVVEDRQIETVVIGRPEGGQSLRMEQCFVKKLREVCPGLKVIEADETLSSKRAGALMLELKTTRKKRRADDDYSAALILQDFLDYGR